MAKVLEVHAGERIDLEDFEQATFTFPKDEMNLNQTKALQDRWSRVFSGFRIEVPDQTLYPGRIVVHNGYALTRTGQRCYNEDFPTTSRAITLDGATKVFYVEIKYILVDADSDARAFWDPTVNNGTDVSGDALPDGQEFSDTVATRKVIDWAIVTPISTTAFTRVATPTTPYIPLAIIDTDAAGKVTGVTTEKAATVLLEDYVALSTKLKVQDPQHFTAGTVTVGLGTGAPDLAVAIVSVDQDSKIITIGGALANPHLAGEIIIRDDVTAPNFIQQSKIGYYAAVSLATPQDDSRDRMFQGDEIHGRILSRGLATPTERSDLNLQSMKDHIDFLSAQIEELKWGSTSPYVTGTDTERIPPGMGTTSIAANPRYYDKSAGVNNSRTAAVTVGNGTTSYGDFNGTSEAAINAAIAALPTLGGTVYIKYGTYTLATDVDITGGKNITIIAEPGTVFTCGAAGRFHVASTGSLRLKGLYIAGGATNVGIYLSTSSLTEFVMEDCYLYDAQFIVHDSVMPTSAAITRCRFRSVGGAMAALSLFNITNAAGRLSGTWSECRFENVAAAAINGACINVSAAGQTNIANFINCSFSMSGLNPEVVHLGTSANTVKFTDCKFTNSGGVGVANYVTITSGSHVWFTNCSGTDTTTSFIQATSVSNLHIDNYANVNATGTSVSQIILINCTNVWVKGCYLRSTSAASWTTAAIYIQRTAASILENIFIEGNEIVGASDSCVGIKLDHTAGGVNSIQNIHIINNIFKACEAGLAFLDTNAGPDNYYNITIKNNTFTDQTSVYQKVGIWIDAGVAVVIEKWNVSGNIFENLNPGNVVLGVRAAFYAPSSTVTYSTFSDNNCYQIGNSGFATATTAAFYFSALNKSSITGNNISKLDGLTTHGICVLGIMYETAIGNNKFYDISGDLAGLKVFGIWADKYQYSTISGNIFNTIEDINGAGFGAVIATDNASGVSEWNTVTITGNSYKGINADSDNTAFISLHAKIIKDVTVTGNVVDDRNYLFLSTNQIAGDTAENLVITGNTMRRGTAGANIYLSSAAATVKAVTISGNNSVDQVALDINGVSAGPLVITGNSFINTNAASKIINLTNCLHAKITGNYCGTLDAAASSPIYLGAGCGICTVIGNTCNQAAGVASPSIDSSAAAGTSYITYNFIDSAANLNIGDNGIAANVEDLVY
jgi:hypothetical protein